MALSIIQKHRRFNMITKEDVATEYLSPHINIVGIAVRKEKEENWYEIELENNCLRNVFNIKAQLRFYDKFGEFLGFEEDTHEAYLEPNRRVALAIYAVPPAKTEQIRLTIDAMSDDNDSDKKDTFIALGIVVFLTGVAAAYSYFFR